MVIDERCMLVRLQRWLTTRRQHPRQAHEGPATAGLPALHPGYRRAGRWEAEDAPGTTPEGWRARLGSFMHVPLGPFLTAFAGFTLEACEELDDGFEYPKTIAVAARRPAG